MSASGGAALPRRRFWGWGYEGEAVEPRALALAEGAVSALLGRALVRRAPPRLDDLALPAPRAALPASLAHLDASTLEERAIHAAGRSYRDLARTTRGRFPTPPDVVAYPATAADVARLLAHASDARLAVVPFGGGTSVCGGVEPLVGPAFRGTLSLDLTRLDRLVDLDPISRAACFEGGVRGPALEAALAPHGLSLRHYPQSFQLSTLGGWIATRAGGHYATVRTHIDDLVEAVTLETPRGTFATRRLPGSGAGPSPERLVIGSEGALGVITSAWVRVVPRPTHRTAGTARFDSMPRALEATRAIAQSDLSPTNCRLLDPIEALVSGTGAGDAALLLLAFESADHPTDAWMARAAELVRDHGGVLPDGEIRSTARADAGRDATADGYKASFFRAPYLRDELILRDVFVETFETAVTWSGFRALDEAVRGAIAALDLGPHVVSLRLTHVYPDGCAPYYTVIAGARAGDEEAQYWDVKRAVTDAVIAHGGTSTHHHAVGRDVMPWYERERPEPFDAVLRAAKAALDPAGVMNPGVLVREG